jgi:hypothetical protein
MFCTRKEGEGEGRGRGGEGERGLKAGLLEAFLVVL